LKNTIQFLALTALYFTASSAGMARQPPAAPPAHPTAQSEAGEPRADTSSPAPADAAGSSDPTSTPAPPPPAAARARRAPTAGTPTAGSPATGSPAAASAPAGSPIAGVAAAPKGPGKADRLDLGTATVTGDREQPKVMYIVPWKRSDIGDLAGKPMNSLVDEILAPVDRDVFKREVIYYQAVQADASQNGAPSTPSQQGEK